jgi:hypothetical protein
MIEKRSKTEEFAQQIAGQAASTYLYGIIRLMSESTILQ